MTTTDDRIVKILGVVDTREYVEEGDRWIPLPGSGTEHECDRCGRFHEVHATVLLESGRTVIVGTGCMGRDNMELKRRFQRADRAAKRLAALIAELQKEEKGEADFARIKREVAALPVPSIIEGTIPKPIGNGRGEDIPTLEMGDVCVWILPGCTRTIEREETLRNQWTRKRMEERGASWGCTTRAGYLRRDIEQVENRIQKLADEN